MKFLHFQSLGVGRRTLGTIFLQGTGSIRASPGLQSGAQLKLFVVPNTAKCLPPVTSQEIKGVGATLRFATGLED
jgi:hypothetical protein